MLGVWRILHNFAKWSKPLPKINKDKEYKKSFAVGDEKAAKLSKSEQELENKQKLIEQENIEKETRKKIAIMKTHDVNLQEYKTRQELNEIKYHQQLFLRGKTTGTKKSRRFEPKPPPVDFEYLPNEAGYISPKTKKYKPFKPVYGNYTSQINARIPEAQQLKEFKGNQDLRRLGTLGVKLGMTTLWDRWGDMIPATIILLDRVQVVQIKQPVDGNTFYQAQLGIGQTSLKKINKATLGHFLKSKVPPKSTLVEFKVSKECLLPVGYMMSARHYTPGMSVDVVGKTVGHGFTGTIKKFGFRRQPETHGNSLTTRVLGSTGGRQDPGRVFKNKKMYGRKGNKNSTQRGITVFRIDVDKNILYLKGAVPGKAGTVIKITDTLLYDKKEKNLDLVHFPTFVEDASKKYAKMFSMYCGERDPDEIEIHDNAFIIDDGEEDFDDGPSKDDPVDDDPE